MSFIEETIFGKTHKIDDSINFLQDTMPPNGYWAGNSGGKESVVLMDLLKRSGVKYDSHHSLTTIDPAPVIYFLREHHPETMIEQPKIPLLKRLIIKGYPDSEYRWCCQEYKERGGSGRICTLGLRRDEGTHRENRSFVETCYMDTSKTNINPLLLWKEPDVWQYIHENKLPYCRLYDEGYKRIGCIGCPLKNIKERKYDFERFPRWRRAFESAFQKRIDYQRTGGVKKISGGLRNAYRWNTGEEAFEWWLNSERHK